MNWEAIGAITGAASLLITLIVEWPHLKPVLAKVPNRIVRVLLSAVTIGISTALWMGIIGAIIGAVIQSNGTSIRISTPWFQASADGKTDNALSVGLGWMICGGVPALLIGAVVGIFAKDKAD